MPLFSVCAGFELVKPCLLGSDLAHVHLHWNLRADLWCGWMFLLDTKHLQNFTSALLSDHVVGWIPVAGSHHILAQTPAIIFTAHPMDVLTGRFLPSPLPSDPLSTGGRWMSPVRRCSGWWGKLSSCFINTKMSSLCIHHCHLLNPDSWTFIHFSLAIKRVCGSQRPSERYGVFWRSEEGVKPFLTGRHPLPAKVDNCPCNSTAILDPISLFFCYRQPKFLIWFENAIVRLCYELVGTDAWKDCVLSSKISGIKFSYASHGCRDTKLSMCC